MRCLRGLAILALTFVPSLLRGQSPDDRYVQAYALIEEADNFKAAGVMRSAVTKYLEAEKAIKELQRLFPEWNPKIVSFRLGYIASALEPLTRAGVAAADAPEKPAAASAKGVQPDPDILKDLKEENLRLSAQSSLLEAKLREALSVQPSSVDPRELRKAEERITQLQKERDLLAASLEQLRLKPAPTPPSASPPSDQVTALKKAIAELETRNTALQEEKKSMERRLLERAKQRASTPSLKKGELEKQLEAARAQLAVLEAKQVPYSVEELALFKQDPAKSGKELTNSPPAARRSKQVPPGAGPLVAEALRAIDAGRFAEAEQKYREVLRQDDQNVYILANLAAVQMDQEKVAEAEETLKRALAIDAHDAPSLYLLGKIKLYQGKLSEAFEALSVSAKLDPEQAETQFLLGKTLVQRGDRAPAEIALRKAIQLKPGWGDAHYLLAVLYTTQKPAFRELAQYHYNKGIKGGAPRNLELEQLMERTDAPKK